MSASLLLRQVGCFHPPMSMSYQPGGARCSHCGQQWIAGANAYEVARWGRKANTQ